MHGVAWWWSTEITSAHLEWRDRDCHFIFGDVCTALVLQRSDEVPSGRGFEVLGAQLVTQFSNNIRNNFGSHEPGRRPRPQGPRPDLYQEGRKVFQEVVPMAAAPSEAHLAALSLAPAQVRRFCRTRPIRA